MGQKQAQEFKFFIRKRDTRAVDRDRVCVEIDDEPAAAQLMCSFSGWQRRSTALTQDTSSITPKGLTR